MLASPSADPGMHDSAPCPSALGLSALSTSIVHTTCVAGCRTFLWGGTGEPKYNADGQCWCSCDGVSWSDVNILGRPSCVPVAAHLTFGWAGLLFSVAGLFHAAFHLHRQMMFHVEQASAASSPIEKCRRQLHVTAILVAILSITYFAMVVGGEVWLSLFVLSALQVPVCISVPILATRMWIYTNDRRVLQESPEVLRISRWLETRRGHHVTYGLVSIAPVVAVLLTFANYAEAAIIIISAGILILSTFVMVTFCVCGKSLVNGIDESLRQQRQMQEQLQKIGVIWENEKETRTTLHDQSSSGDALLLAARKKVKMIVIFAVTVLVKVMCMLFFAMGSRYGLETPLVFFLSPMTLVPPIWNIVNVTIHRGRTRLSSSGIASNGQSRVLASFSPSYLWDHRSRQRLVAVRETAMTAP